MITVFTPAYNRGYILHKLYESLCEQTCRDFEWLIIDDGSTDNTEELVNKWIGEEKINIRYYKQLNGGKHRAINRGVALARGDWFFIVDSDDCLTSDAVAFVCEKVKEIEADKSFAGISGTRLTPQGWRIGGELDFDSLDCSAIDLRLKYGVCGDMAEIYRTEVLQAYPFPEFDGEKFCPEALVWNRIARNFRLRYFNHGIYICEYLPDGLTKGIIKARRNSPLASMTYYSELYHTPISMTQKAKAAINFWRFADKFEPGRYGITSILSLLSLPLGKLMRFNDLRKI